MTENSKSFIENLMELRSAASKMREMQEPDVDAIMPLVVSGTKSYEACRERIEKVKAMLQGSVEAG